MRHGDALNRWYETSGQTSDRARHLSFAGIAVVWVVSGGGEHPTNVTIARDLVPPLFALLLALFLDFIQYAVQALQWRVFSRKKEKELRAKHNSDPAWRDEVFDNPLWINTPGEVCFWTKVVVLSFGYALLAVELVDRLL